MPSLVALLGIDPAASSVTLQRASTMVDATLEADHRKGLVDLSKVHAVLGWTDFATHGREPFLWSETRDIGLLLLGEEFGGPSDSTLQRMIEGYGQHGDAFLGSLNGGFAGVLVDVRRSRTLVFVDRYAACRLYVHESIDGLLVSTRASALARVLPQTRRFDPVALAQTLVMGCTIEGRSLYQGIETLTPASLWIVEGRSRPIKRCYFDPTTWSRHALLGEPEFTHALAEFCARRIPAYLGGERRVGMSLTGGLDGRIVMAWAAASPGTLPTYTFAGPFRECHDVRIAREVARTCGQTHESIPVGERMLADFDRLARECVRVSDGTMDVSGAVEVHANRLAAAIAPVRLTGNYGSEIVRANVAFRPREVDHSTVQAAIEPHLTAARDAYHKRRADTHPVTFIAFTQVPSHHHARRSIEQALLDVRSPFLDDEFVALMHRAPTGFVDRIQPLLDLVHQGLPSLATLPSDRGYVRGPDTPMRRLRTALREFSAKAEYAYDYGMPQRLARIDRRLGPLRLERLFLGRHKFYHFRTWYRHELAPYVRRTLLDTQALERSCFRPEALRRMVEEHTSGRGNHTLALHRALTVELTQQELFDAWPTADGPLAKVATSASP